MRDEKRHPSVVRLRRLAGLCVLLAILAGTALPAAAQSERRHEVQAGETLFGIARRYDTTVEALRAHNRLPDATIRVGQLLRIPPAGAEAEPAPEATPAPVEAGEAPSDPPVAAPEPVDADVSGSPEGGRPEGAAEVVGEGGEALAGRRYVVQEGDTFYALAARYGTKAYLLQALNGNRTAPLEPGDMLVLPEGAGAAGEETVEVRAGDTLFGVAKRHGVSVEALRAANALTTDALQAGQRLRLPGEASAPATEERLPPVYARGDVVVYPETYAGRLTAAGRTYDPDAFTVSHPDLPLGTLLLVEEPSSGRMVFAEVTDRGPLQPGYLLDVSQAVARELGLGDGAHPVQIRAVE